MRFVHSSIAIAALISCGAPTLFAADQAIESVMYRDPPLPAPKVILKLPSRLPALWLEALERPETDMKTQAAQAIALAHERGLPGMNVTIGPLRKQLQNRDLDATARLAIVRTIIVLDAKEAAPDLANVIDADPDVRNLIEPALAKWDYKPVRKIWLDRLSAANSRRSTILAIQGLGIVREVSAMEPLRKIVLDRESPATIRVEAARAIGIIRTAGSESEAAGLADKSATRTDRLSAVLLLHNHAGDHAVQQLQSLGRDSEPTVAAIALARLIEIDSKLAVPLIDSTLASPDANVRRLGVEILFRQPSGPHLRLLGDRLNDLHPDVRIRSRHAMESLAAKPEWREVAIREGTRLLGGSDWRGLEQATILLAQLSHKPAATRLVELLRHARPEVYSSAAWALRKLAVPETLPLALAYFDGQYKGTIAQDPTSKRTETATDSIDHQLSHLAQFFGQARYAPADSLLRKLVPAANANNPAGPETRAGAAWALGLLHEGKDDGALSRVFVGRLNAVRPFDVEDNRVRRMCAISLGRMKSNAALGSLREFYPAKAPSLDVVGNACGWALEQITGEKVPAPGTVEILQRNWFLTPTD